MNKWLVIMIVSGILLALLFGCNSCVTNYGKQKSQPAPTATIRGAVNIPGTPAPVQAVLRGTPVPGNGLVTYRVEKLTR